MSTTPAQNASHRSGPSGSRTASSGVKVNGAAVTGVAAVASASIVIPLAADSATAYEMLPGESIVPQAYQAAVESAPAAGYQQAMVPQVAQSNRAVFAPGYSEIAEQGFSAQAVSASSVRQPAAGQLSASASIDAASQSPVLGKDAAGNWTVSYTPRQGQNTQAVVAQVAQAASGDQVPSGGRYISAQLPEARRKVEALQQKLKDFEAEYGQVDIGSYQRLLNSRIAEISQQRSQLDTSLEDTRKLITQLKMRLVTVNADLGLAEQVIAQDMAYQTVWQRLQKSEEALLTEFSKVSIDSETLNGTYSDYQYHQQWLQRTVQEALSNYLMAEGAAPPDFIYRAPAALNVMQDLVVATHEYQVQQLRQSTITTIEQRLQARQASLLENVGEYEGLQRDLATAQQVLNKYESAGNSSVVQAAIDPNVSAVERAQTLSLEIPGGSVGKALLGIVAAGGALATVLARRRRSSDVFKPTVLSIAPTNGSSALALYGANQHGMQAYGDEGRAIAVAQAAMVAQQPQLSAQNPMEADLLDELLAVTGRPAPTLAMTAGLLGADLAHGSEGEPKLLGPADLMAVTGESVETLSQDSEETLDGDIAMADMVTAMTAAVAVEDNEIVQMDDVLADDELSVELLTRELDDAIAQATTTEERLSEEVRSRPVEPVHLSLDEIDLFAEQAIRWVLKDLGYVPAESANVSPANAPSANVPPANAPLEAQAILDADNQIVSEAYSAEPADELSDLERALSELALSELPAPELPAAVSSMAERPNPSGRYSFPPRSVLSKRDDHEDTAAFDEAIAKAYAESWETVSVG
ncbi:MAG: hypothetical protein AAFP03_10755 [Cyanobacteria bacterium J06598_3]